MNDWKYPTQLAQNLLEWIATPETIAEASRSAAIGNLSTSINYAPNNQSNFGLEISHLLSGAKLENWRLADAAHQQLIDAPNRTDYLNQQEQQIVQKASSYTEHQKLFWWLWRCLPVEVCQTFGNESLRDWAGCETPLLFSPKPSVCSLVSRFNSDSRQF